MSVQSHPRINLAIIISLASELLAFQTWIFLYLRLSSRNALLSPAYIVDKSDLQYVVIIIEQVKF